MVALKQRIPAMWDFYGRQCVLLLLESRAIPKDPSHVGAHERTIHSEKQCVGEARCQWLRIISKTYIFMTHDYLFGEQNEECH